MFVAIWNGVALVRTPYSEKYDLVQKFRGAEKSSVCVNEPIDFMEAGLIRRDKWDMWHLDVPFAISSDEAPALTVNEAYIGENHGQPCAILLYAPAHDKTPADIGSVWRDEAGVTFTLMRIVHADCLMFVSENVGKSKEDYVFVTKIEGKLTFVSDGVHTSFVPASNEQRIAFLNRAYRFTKMEIFGMQNGAEKRVIGSMECDRVRMEEEYALVNPATMAPALTAARPEGGYAKMPDLADFGETMLLHRMVYHVLEDGTVLCEFDHKKTMDVRFSVCMGAMYQEKLDVYGGGIHRCLPKTLPLDTPEGKFDFSSPYALLPGPFPKNYRVSSSDWETPDSPPDRVVDYFRDTDGHDRLGFACGYLPLYDGIPQKRLMHLAHSMHIVGTRKAYPIFMDGDLSAVHGVAYKKYFRPEKDGASVYTVEAERKTYIFMDFFRECTLSVPVTGSVTLYEKSDSVLYEIKDGVLSATGKKGYAVFIAA